MKLTRIHQIEITTRCNLACKYCPHPKLKREKMDMSLDTFERALEWVEFFDKQGTQKELAITGMGEALLHPSLMFMLNMIRSDYDYNGYLHFSTNGILFDKEIAAFCKDYGIKVYISGHRPEAAPQAIEIALKHDVLAGTNFSFAYSALDSVGTVDWKNTAPDNLVCQYQKQAWGMVLVDGSISTCCWEPEGVNVIGHVNDPIGSVDMRIMPGCSSCSLIIENGEQERRVAL